MAGAETRGGWIVGLVMGAALLGSGYAVAVETGTPITIGLLVIDQAGVPPNVLIRAKQEATRIYDGIGITLVWLDMGAIGVGHRRTIKIVTHALAGRGIASSALGVAAGTTETRGTMAYAFYQRIQDTAHVIGTNTGMLLGHVIAHEIGHLLLPYNAHGTTGLMRGSWDTEQAVRASRGLLTFTTQEADLIRQRLVRHDD